MATAPNSSEAIDRGAIGAGMPDLAGRVRAILSGPGVSARMTVATPNWSSVEISGTKVMAGTPAERTAYNATRPRAPAFGRFRCRVPFSLALV